MSFLLGVVIFVVAVLISVILHEAGHFVAAKKFGMKATQFFIGFGPTLWSTTRGETEYGIKALPFGAFVRITGMTTLDEVDPADEPRSMRNKPAWQRAIVMVAGSFMHFALAFVLLLFLAIGIGQPNENTTTVGSVSSCVPVSLKAFDQGSCSGQQGRLARRAGRDQERRQDHRDCRQAGAQLDPARHRHPRPAGRKAGVGDRAAGRQAAHR